MIGWGGKSVLVVLFGVVLAAVSLASAGATTVGTATEYSAGLSMATSDPAEIAPGPEGDLWFADEGRLAAIGRITTSGAISEFSSGLQEGSKPYGITTGPEGDIWFTDRGHSSAVGRLLPNGDTITEFSAGLTSESFLWGNITPGPNGDLWFVEWDRAIGYVTPAGQITEWPDNRYPVAITQGQEGDLWVVLRPGFGTGAIERITPTGEPTFFSAGMQKGAEPAAIALGPDGNLWFLDDGPTRAVGRITPAGQITEFTAGLSPQSWMNHIAPGPDGNMWFTDENSKTIDRITMNGEITPFTPGGINPSGPDSVAPGADGNIWFTRGNYSEHYQPTVSKLTTGAPAALVSPPILDGLADAGESQTCQPAAWSTWVGEQPSTRLWSFDGYRWLLNGAPVAQGQSFTPVAADDQKRLACQETVTYPSPFYVSAVAESATTTIKMPPPVLADLRESSNRWREGNKLTAINPRVTRPTGSSKAGAGTVISFSLNEPATLTFSLSKIVTMPNGDRHCRSKCRRRVIAEGKLILRGQTGTNRVYFQGRLSPTNKLRPGAYILTAIATNNEHQHSAAHRLYFAVLPVHRPWMNLR